MNSKKLNEACGKSETITENIFREFYGALTFIEKSAIPNYFGFKSKKRTDYKGYPDFFKEEEDFVIIVEAKADNYMDACKEVKNYAETNSISKDIIAIALSGQTKKSYKAGLFLLIQGGKYTEIETDGKLLPIKDILKSYRKHKYGESISTEALVNSLKQLNKQFHEDIKIRDTERSLFFAGLMIALKDSTFISTYRGIKGPNKEERNAADSKLLESHNLNLAILDAITRQIYNKANNHSKEYNWRDRFSFIKNIDFPLKAYIEIIKIIEEQIFMPFKMDEKQDILGRAYKIFLSRAGKVENKNIILTPDHIKSLMIELARLDVDDVVIDTCTGSGGFLMEAMEHLTELAKNNSQKIDHIKSKQLIGFEIDPILFALSCSNMFLHGDGRTNLIFGSSLVDESINEEKIIFDYIKTLAPTKCIINPPYENNNPIIFTKQALEYLQPNGRLIIIMPTPTLSKSVNGMTDEILKVARLDFVIKMPNNLFSEQKRTVNTSIFGFTKTKHDPLDEVIFYNMDNDGYVSVQHKGRIDKFGVWDAIKGKVLDCIKYSKNVDAEYEKRCIFDAGILNCYGVPKFNRSGSDMMRVGALFNFEKGSLPSENNEDGEFDFITASEERKKHVSFDHDKEALVYAVAASGSLGRCHYVNGKFIASNLCLILTPKNSDKYPVNLAFYNLYFNALRKKIVNEIADGTSKLTINEKELANYYVEYIPKSVQDEFVLKYIPKVSMLENQLKMAKTDLNNKLITIIK